VTPLEYAGLTVFILVLLIGFFSILMGLPGTLVILFDVLVYALVTGFDRIGFKILLTLVVISAIAASLEFLLGSPGQSATEPRSGALRPRSSAGSSGPFS